MHQQRSCEKLLLLLLLKTFHAGMRKSMTVERWHTKQSIFVSLAVIAVAKQFLRFVGQCVKISLFKQLQKQCVPFETTGVFSFYFSGRFWKKSARSYRRYSWNSRHPQEQCQQRKHNPVAWLQSWGKILYKYEQRISSLEAEEWDVQSNFTPSSEMKSSLYHIYHLLDDQERTALYSNKGRIFIYEFHDRTGKL